MSTSTTDSVNNNRLGSFYNNEELNCNFKLVGITKNEQNAKDIAALKSNLEITQSDLKSKIKENEQNAKDIAALKSNLEITQSDLKSKIKENEQNAKDIAALKSNLEFTQSDLKNKINENEQNAKDIAALESNLKKSKINENEQNAKDIAALESNLKSKIKENQYLEKKVSQITNAIFKYPKQNPSLSLLSDSLPELEIKDCSAYSNLDFSHLSKLTRLRKLTLKNCVNDACDENFIKHVKDLPITSLTIKGIKGFSDVGVTALPRNLESLVSIPRENATFTNIGDFPNSLRHMVIFNCVNLKKEHIIKMSESLTQLTKIDFALSTCIKNDFLPHFPKTLTHLYLSWCGINYGQIKLDSLKELNTIDVNGWGCAAEKIVKALPKSVKRIVENNYEKREAFKQAIGDSNISVAGCP